MNNITIADDILRKKILYCWLGKSIGGTLGAPYEGVCEELNLNYYNPVPTQMLPNDDLDLQVIWAVKLSEMKNPVVSRKVFIPAWKDNIGYNWDEYGVAKRNLALGLKPPLTGSYDNWFTNGLGAAIRSEIWACLAPGNPKLASLYAFEDACVDHAGEGIYAEMFLAAAQSKAFIQNEIEDLIETGLSVIPRTSLLARAITDTCNWYHNFKDWRRVRAMILQNYPNDNWTDVCINVPFMILALLEGQGDFGRSICAAVNCGYDTDCTGATVGALLGISRPDSIMSKWLKPIGDNLVLSPEITGIDAPADLHSFTQLVIDLYNRIGGQPPVAYNINQNCDCLKIKAHLGFLDSYLYRTMPKPGQPCWKMPENIRPIQLDGTIGVLEHNEIHGQTIMLRYEITIPKACDARVLFNTSQRCVVWVDDEFAFGYESPQAIVPAFHRDSYNCKRVHRFTQGSHIVTAAIEKPASGERLRWVIGLADPISNEWLPFVFDREELANQS